MSKVKLSIIFSDEAFFFMGELQVYNWTLP